MMDGLTEGVTRRRCPECGVEVEVRRAAGALDRATSKAQRNRIAQAIRGQIIWPTLCPACAAWWNGIIKELIDPAPTDQRRVAA